MKRREFMNWVGLGVLASSLPVAIAACQSPSEEGASTSGGAAADKPKLDKSPREDGFAAVGTVADLDANGSVSDKKFIRDAVIVVRDPANPEAVIALTSMCTHQGCTVDWDKDNSVLACPCHQSKFKTDGTVESGPATTPLTQFDAIIDGDLVLVQTKA